jgi:hypothetical protein
MLEVMHCNLGSVVYVYSDQINVDRLYPRTKNVSGMLIYRGHGKHKKSLQLPR